MKLEERMLYTSKEIEFIKTIEAFIAHEYPKHLLEKAQKREEFEQKDFMFWQKKLSEKGWGAPLWPKEFGGTGWNELEKYLFYSTLYKHNVLIQLPFGPTMLAPVLMTFGNEKQKEYYLPKILNGEHIWCQGYSEPNAGSDLASLQMKAEKKKDHYLLNGTKIWTTIAQYANMIFCLVRTSSEGKPQAGISFVLIDLDSPGITISPIITADRAHEVNQITFENVKIPLENLVGEENKGWDYAKFLLTYERSSFGARLARVEYEIQELLKGIKTENSTQAMMFLAELLELESHVKCAKLTMLRVVTNSNKAQALKLSSIIKMITTRALQDLSDFKMRFYGQDAIVDGSILSHDFFDLEEKNQANLLANDYLNKRKESIYAGSNEIQANIIAKFILGLK